MLLGFGGCVYAHCIALIFLGHAQDGLGDSGREHQRAARFWRGI